MSSESSYGFVGGTYGWSLLSQKSEVRDNDNIEKGGDTEPLGNHERLDPFYHYFSGFLSSESFRASTDTICEA